jgi:hypothetical protein
MSAGFYRGTVRLQCFGREHHALQSAQGSDLRCDRHDSWIATSWRASSIALGPDAGAWRGPIAPTTVFSKPTLAILIDSDLLRQNDRMVSHHTPPQN